MNASFHRALSRSAWSALALFAAPALAEPVFTVTSPIDAVDAAPGDGACASAAGACTLRAAVMEANALAGADTIVLPAGTYGRTIANANAGTEYEQEEDFAATGDLDVFGDLTLTGAGAAATIIDARGLDRVLHVLEAATVAVSGVTLRGGNVRYNWPAGGC